MLAMCPERPTPRTSAPPGGEPRSQPAVRACRSTLARLIVQPPPDAASLVGAPVCGGERDPPPEPSPCAHPSLFLLETTPTFISRPSCVVVGHPHRCGR